MSRRKTAVDTAPAHVGETMVVHRRATDETGEEIGFGSVARLTRRAATDETGESIAGGSAGTESWTPVEPDGPKR